MRIMILADYYSAYLDYFYRNRDLSDKIYNDHLETLLDDYFSSFVSYYRHFKKLGHQVFLVIGNDMRLQKKWLDETDIQIEPTLLNKHEIVLKQIEVFRPDVFFIGSMFDYFGAFLDKTSRYTKNIFAWIACPYPDDLDLSNIRCIISSSDEYVETFRSKGFRSEVLKAAFDADIIKNFNNKDIFDTTFIGGLSKNLHSIRVQGLNYLLNAGIDLKVFGYGLTKKKFPLSLFSNRLEKAFMGERWGLEMYQTLNNSKISLNFHIDVAQGMSENMRMYEATGCGTLLLTEKTPGLHSKFEDGKEVVGYENFNDLLEKIKYYLSHDKERESISSAGQKACLERHGYHLRIIDFERILLKYSI